jgi:hypothetical protein
MKKQELRYDDGKYIEVAKVVRYTFDIMENSYVQAVREDAVARFVKTKKKSAFGCAKEWIDEQPPVKLYLGHDGRSYPYYRVLLDLIRDE